MINGNKLKSGRVEKSERQADGEKEKKSYLLLSTLIQGDVWENIAQSITSYGIYLVQEEYGTT